MTKILVVLDIKEDKGFLYQSLESLKTQNYTDFVVLPVTSEVNPALVDVCAEYTEADERFLPAVELSQITRQLKKHSPEYVYYLNSNAFLSENMLAKAYSKVFATNADLLLCQTAYFDDKTQAKSEIYVQKLALPNKNLFSPLDVYAKNLNILTADSAALIYKTDFLLKNHDLASIPSWAERVCLFLKAKNISALRSEDVFIRPQNLFKKEIEKIAAEFADNAEKLFSFLSSKENKNLLSDLKVFVARYAYNIYLALYEPQKTEFSLLMSELCKKHNFEQTYNLYNIPQVFEWVINQPKATIKKPILPIVYMAKDEGEAYGACVSADSLLQNSSRDYFYRIHIICANEVDDNVVSSINHQEKKNAEIICRKISEYTMLLKTAKELGLQYFPLLGLEVMCGYEKFLYLAPDTLVLHDITELFEEDLTRVVLAGVQDFEQINYVEKELNLLWETYINDGVLLINSALWQKENVFERALALISQKKLPNKEILNKACFASIKILDTVWNVSQTKFLDIYKNYDYPRFVEEAYIIRFDGLNFGKFKSSKLQNIWWKYARKSEFYEHFILLNTKDRITKLRMVHKAKILQFVMSNRERFEPIMKEYAKEILLSIFTFGATSKTHREKAQEALNVIVESMP